MDLLSTVGQFYSLMSRTLRILDHNNTSRYESKHTRSILTTNHHSTTLYDLAQSGFSLWGIFSLSTSTLSSPLPPFLPGILLWPFSI
ncbi:hypothetical protein BHE90_002376 [Fusarium euwallaceae]|uniref:Uncharacterized protein n=2 Tax=Fusarium solani species complex TaxID=232080 RepID=A0A3M2SDQ7_9HYPO|nr:hypothetical protein CDV36_004986 [Fusarium kuroshium]RTE83127.1 hypothetical protein BHE90_002376 [Fusarium euwallaceae]